MKRAIFSTVFSIIIVCFSSILVCLAINTHFTKIDQIETITKESIGSIECLKNSNILTANNGANHELSTQLKGIEDILMEETNAGVLDYLDDHPESDITSLWNQISQEIHTILAPKDPKIIMRYPKTKKRKVVMKNSQKSTALHSQICKEPSLEVFVEENNIDLSPSNSDPKISQISHRRRGKKYKAKLVGSPDGAYGSKLRAYSKSKHLEKFPTGEAVKEWLSYSHCQARSTASLLKLKGALAIWHNANVSRQIDCFFERLDKNIYFSLWNFSNSAHHPDKVSFTIERVKTDIVMAFFGGLSMIFQCSPMAEEVSIEDIVFDGWVYLQNYLNQVFCHCQDEISKHLSSPKHDPHNLSSPSNLPKYMLNLGKDSPVQPTLIGELLSNWSRETDFKPAQWKIEFSTYSFLSAIFTEGELRGKTIRATRLSRVYDDTKSPSFNFPCSMIPYISECDVEKLKNLKDSRPTIYLAKIGRSVMKEHMSFKQDVKIFFETLENDMVESLTRGINSISAGLRTDHSHQMIIEPIRIRNAISAVKFHMMPAFLGTLIVLSHHQLTKQVIQTLLRTGWETLQAYFSPWGKYLSENTSSIILTKKKKQAHEVSWYNPKDPIHYFCLHKNMVNIPIEPVWFLYELWYETAISKKVIWGQDIDFEPSPPNRDVLHRIISLLRTWGLTSQ
ncbi:hypothetical protein DFH28DRAFT_1049265 [Melampsora americana]|nr:hypothetical protein DFH28DRAFT_1049265 [Melampsora americana]